MKRPACIDAKDKVAGRTVYVDDARDGAWLIALTVTSRIATGHLSRQDEIATKPGGLEVYMLDRARRLANVALHNHALPHCARSPVPVHCSASNPSGR